MIVGTEVLRRGSWSDAADTITLEEQARHRRRMAMVSDGGIAFLLDLAEARLMRDGDAIQLDDGRLIEVKAQPEALYAVRGTDARHLLALAWQIGNRHVPAEFHADRILLPRDPAIADMLRELGAEITEVEAAFDPEGGAYSGHAHQDGASAGEPGPGEQGPDERW